MATTLYISLLWRILHLKMEHLLLSCVTTMTSRCYYEHTSTIFGKSSSGYPLLCAAIASSRCCSGPTLTGIRGFKNVSHSFQKSAAISGISNKVWFFGLGRISSTIHSNRLYWMWQEAERVNRRFGVPQAMQTGCLFR